MTTQTVKFNGGAMHGVIVEAPAGLDLTAMRLSVTPSGRLYDRTRERYVAGATVVQGPQERTPARTPRRRRAAHSPAASS